MKNNVQNLALLSAVIAFASCQQHKQATIDESGNEVIKVRQPAEDTDATPKETTIVEDAVETKPEKPALVATKNKTLTPEPAVAKPAGEAVKPGRALTVKGVVREINRGKDGYTAKIEMPDGQMVSATVSRSNLTEPKQYREVQVGDMLKVSGESWKLDNESQLTVRVLH